MSDPAQLYDAILNGNAKLAESITKAAIEAKFDPNELVQQVHDSGDGRGRPAVRVQRVLRARVADRRPRDEDVARADHAAPGRRRARAGRAAW